VYIVHVVNFSKGDKTMSKKVNITLDDNLLERARTFADENYLSFSGLMSLSLTQYLNQNDILRAVQEISLAMRKIADNKELTEEEINNLKDFENFSKMLVGK
jgi:hypothetical protein